MKFIISLLLVFLFPLKNCICQTVTENEIYDFINAICPADSGKLYYLEDRIEVTDTFRMTGPFTKGLDTIFTEKDAEAMNTQIANYKGYSTWKRAKLTNATIITENRLNEIFKYPKGKAPFKHDGWTKFYTRYGDKKHIRGYFYYSMPLFSADHNKCIIYKSEQCGDLCASFCTEIYKRVNGRWIFFKSLGCLVS